jgi:hypothetical protein
MTDNGKAAQLKLQKAKENAAGHRMATRKVFLGNFVYAEFIKGGYVRLTDEDGRGRPLDTIQLNHYQVEKLFEGYRESN